jgi:CheY-like chemotaxis protein
VNINVTDTGIGIASEHLERIFGAFSQADASTTRKYGGTGLGLTICRRLIELMGGSIRVESFPGKGSAFQVSLPFQVASQFEAESPHQKIPYFWEGAPLTILVAEDNAINQKFISATLGSMGHVAVCCDDGLQAVEIWRCGSFDYILMDIQMPVMGGEEALKLIRNEENAREKHTPIIALTAHTLKGDRERFMESGFDAYLSKPLQIGELAEVLKQLHVS